MFLPVVFGSPRRLAFVLGGSKIGPSVGIAVINEDGSGLQQLTANPTDRNPSWSPDGQQLAFYSIRDTIAGLYRMHADGSQPIRIFQCPAACTNPVWSPDGQSIAFAMLTTSSNLPPNFEIYVVHPDGSGLHQVTQRAEDDWAPSWSPDSTQVVFESRSRDGTASAIYRMNVDGSAITRLTAPPAVATAPSWSPDGSQIAFIPDVGASTIAVMAPDGTNVQYLPLDTVSPPYSGDPIQVAWSADGRRLAYTAFIVGNTSIDVVNIDGTGHIRLSGGGGPVWQP